MPHDIIIVDDEKDIIATIEMYCEQVGIFRHIIKAYDGIEAGIKINNQSFSVIVLDINLPKKNGIDLLKIIGESKGNEISKVILISGGMSKDHIAHATNMGVKHFLVKPFDASAFADKLKKVLTTK